MSVFFTPLMLSGAGHNFKWLKNVVIQLSALLKLQNIFFYLEKQRYGLFFSKIHTVFLYVIFFQTCRYFEFIIMHRI